MSDELIDRLRHANEHSVQRITGSNIFGEAADKIAALRLELLSALGEAGANLDRAVKAEAERDAYREVGFQYVRSSLDDSEAIASLTAERDAALSQVDRMREALEFYAPKEINGIKFSGGDDNGNRARRALTPEEPTP